MKIYYFSGTGNSLHTAKELKKRISSCELIPIVSLLRQKQIKIDAETAGLVFPLYLTFLPAPVIEFIEKADFSSVKYIFAFLTRQGTFYTAAHYLRKMLKKKGKQLNSFFIQNMVNNSPTGIRPTPGDKDWPSKISSEKIYELESALQERLDNVVRIIKTLENFNEKGSRSFLTKIFTPLFSLLVKGSKSEIQYLVDETCTGCGNCVKVCPSNKLKLTDCKPEWRKEIKCYYCFACFNFCPEQAILIKYYKDKKGRYHHPDVSLNEIAAQK